ncbi:MAG: DNA recombination protein RmuC [Coleofasciculaceae cyanobacterium RL_1_1]|nr:DNA recombination protein RmuC [Coleofasciculaceae cyanobacterium RL_1_1]
MNFIFGLLIGLALGALIAWLVFDKKNQASFNQKISVSEKRRADSDMERIAIQNQLAQSLKQQDSLNERLQISESARAVAESQLAKTRDRIDNGKEQFEKLHIKNVQLESKVVNLESQLVESRKISNESKSRAEQLQSENSKLIARAAEAESQLSEVRRDAAEKKSQLTQLQAANTQLESRSVEAETKLEASQRNIEDQKKLILVAEEKLSKTFKALAIRVLKENEKEISEEISGTVIEPLKVKISELSQYVERVEKSRTESHGELKHQIHSLMQSQKDMELQAEKLSKALREPSGRGRWGEIQLRRVAELAGMHSYCDFLSKKVLKQEMEKFALICVFSYLPGKISLSILKFHWMHILIL